MKRPVLIPYVPVHTGELELAVKSLDNIEHGEVHILDKNLRMFPDYNRFSPYHDVQEKLRYAVSIGLGEDEFIWSMDDVFIMKPIKEIPCYYRGTLDDHIKSRRRMDQYTRALVSTNEFLKRQGVEEPLSFELHIPYVLNSEKFKEISILTSNEFKRGTNLLMRSVYFNLVDCPAVIHHDVKNAVDYKKETFLSTSNSTFNGEIGDFIKQKLGNGEI